MESINLEAYFRAIAREEAERVYEEKREVTVPSGDSEVGDYRRRIDTIMVKKYISVGEVAFLLNCSDSYVRKLIKRAQKKETRHPIPFTDLDGHVVFELSRLLEWAEMPKSKFRAAS